jgi:hypothetical protein
MKTIKTKITEVSWGNLASVSTRALFDVFNNTGGFILALLIVVLHSGRMSLAELKPVIVFAIYSFNILMFLFCARQKYIYIAWDLSSVPLLYSPLIHQMGWCLVLPLIIHSLI